ncbi:MAG: thiamine pyrophosphate-dependent dehydrogenase E1 component subunit alpha [Gammaproteobacteria bacterium]|nr:thiamine pyrophosphate-dependent dehydrogenase E1 component subunit alpha [Gammaproteobacteria bacterium]
MPLGHDDLLRAYRILKTIREFEMRVSKEYEAGTIPGFTHLYLGQEAVAAGFCMHLTDDDSISSTHRGHGHCIAKGCDVRRMMLEIYCKRDGTCHGKGGSMHIAELWRGMLGANGIVGAGVPLALGAALSAKTRGTDRVAVAFGGDGSTNQGGVFESMNMAVVLKLPLIFAVENNGYGEHTGIAYHLGAPSIASRAAGFGMPASEADGADFFAVYEAAGAAIARARAGGGPMTVVCDAPRWRGHFEGDAQAYRDPNEIRHIREHRDCVKRFRERVLGDGTLTAAELDAIDAEVLRLIEESVVAAKAAPQPRPEDLTSDVYVSY